MESANSTQKNPIDNLTFDWLTVLQSKAEGVNAYEKYISDAQAVNARECVALLEKLRDQDIDILTEVRDHVKAMMSRSDMGMQASGSGDEATASHSIQ